MADWLGLIRSLFVYWRPGRQRGLRRLYAPMIQKGDLVFDVGAHLGDRSAAFAALGARVISLEPQPFIARWLRRLVGRRAHVTVRSEAVGRSAGTARIAVSRRTPTVSSLSDAWRERVAQTNPGFAAVAWDDAVEVPVVTLDALIVAHGVPSFCKIDVEGFELEVLAGLSQPVRALSIEFVSGDLATTIGCVDRLCELGPYEFNAVIGESRDFEFERWVGPADIRGWLDSGAYGASSGDLYARLASDTPTPGPVDNESTSLATDPERAP